MVCLRFTLCFIASVTPGSPLDQFIPKQIKAFRNLLKNDFRKLVRKVIPKKIALEQVQVWFQDETRIGQQGSLSRLWAKKGTRPRVVRQQQFMYQYIFGAVCPEEQEAAAIIAPSANAATMQLHLDEISLHIPTEKHGVIIKTIPIKQRKFSHRRLLY